MIESLIAPTVPHLAVQTDYVSTRRQSPQDEWVTNTKSLPTRDQAFLLGRSCELKFNGSQIVRLGDPNELTHPAVNGAQLLNTVLDDGRLGAFVVVNAHSGTGGPVDMTPLGALGISERRRNPELWQAVRTPRADPVRPG